MGYKIGIIGATGLVGQEIIHWLNKLQFPYNELKLIASSKSVGKKLEIIGKSHIIENLNEAIFEDLDLAFFCASENISAEYIPKAVAQGCIVIDNSSFFRLDKDIPLIIPEINGNSLSKHNRIIANPNCTAAITLMALYPLHIAFGLKRLFASTYQAVSGSGYMGMNELDDQIKAWAGNKNAKQHTVYAHPIAFNVIPQVGKFEENGYTSEEVKMTNEIQKILIDPTIKISTTCVRVPVWRSHSIAVNAEFERAIDLEEARDALNSFKGVKLLGFEDASEYPVPLTFSESKSCGIGRLRRDMAFENGLSFWIVGDQLWKGAALNAVQIAQLIELKN